MKKIGVFSALLLVAVTTTAQTPVDALEDKQCDYRAHAAFNTGVAQAPSFDLDIWYDQPHCQGAKLHVRIGSVISLLLLNTYAFEMLNYYDDATTKGERYVQQKLAQLTQPIPWPDYESPTQRLGFSCDNYSSALAARNDISAEQKQQIMWDMEMECEVGRVEFDISPQHYRSLRSSGAHLYCLRLVESSTMVVYDAATNSVIQIGSQC